MAIGERGAMAGNLVGERVSIARGIDRVYG
jgi:hypothetical protein